METTETMRRLQLFLLSVLLLSLSGCISMSTHQTGRTLGKNNLAISGSAIVGDMLPTQIVTLKDSIITGNLEVGAMMGITEKFDVGVKINGSVHITGQAKYQWLGNKSSLFASSGLLEIGISPVASSFSILGYSLALAAVNSVHLRDNLAIDLTPKFYHTGSGISFIVNKKLTSHTMQGYTAGIIYGKKHQWSFEYSRFSRNQSISHAIYPQFSIGYIYNMR